MLCDDRLDRELAVACVSGVATVAETTQRCALYGNLQPAQTRIDAGSTRRNTSVISTAENEIFMDRAV